MIGKLFGKFFKSHNDRQVKSYMVKVPKINEIEIQLQSLSNEELIAKTDEFKKRFKDGETLDQLMPEAYAVVKNACRRLCGTTHDILG
ncbi:MAG: hypothetical protein KAG98_06350, partial [Lentisphaeria bacterium]|nr:hypothetical protein [Lentisphaeria bacterium]